MLKMFFFQPGCQSYPRLSKKFIYVQVIILNLDLDILPSTYSTPLYYTPEELEYLKGSPTLSKFSF